jgi:hypothetical protein
MNAFQQKAIDAVTNATASSTSPRLAFTPVHGKRDDDFVATALRADQSFEVFVYEDEGGCTKNGSDWTICERPDFDSEEVLIERFVAHVKAALA